MVVVTDGAVYAVNSALRAGPSLRMAHDQIASVDAPPGQAMRFHLADGSVQELGCHRADVILAAHHRYGCSHS